MPTVLRLDGLRVIAYPNDHRPAHVHVVGGGCEAVFNLHCRAGSVGLRENYGYTRPRIAQIARALRDKLGELCGAWREIHGIE